MKPITRKELYLNKIVGNNDYEIPEKPITTEEFFFAEILGEAVQAPEPLTRYQMYLAKIAGREIGIPYPETRLERFLTKAAGMNISVPTPITREEILWNNYSAIIDFELEGIPPLTFKAKKAGTLKDYRIYGNTAGGESVGDLVAEGEHAGEYKVPVTVEGKNLFNFDEPNVKGYDFEKQSEGVYYIADTGSLYSANRYKLDTETGKQYVLKGVIDNTTISVQLSGFLEGTENPVEGQIFKTGNINIIFTANGKTTLTIFGSKSNQSATVTNLQVYDISITDDTYEPYQTPVTTNLYLPEQIKKVGDEAEYIDYGEQKQHRIGADNIDVTLPALPTLTGTNVLSVGTAVQPSKVYVKYKGERQ